MTPKPIATIAITAPPLDLARMFGYDGAARFVGVTWHDTPGTAAVTDGVRNEISGWNAAWQLFAEHPTVEPFLAGFNLGGEGRAPVHMLVLDRVRNTISVLPYSTAPDYLRARNEHEPRTGSRRTPPDIDDMWQSAHDLQVLEAWLNQRRPTSP